MMNFSDNFTEAVNYNEETLYLRIPALIFLAFVLPFGVMGNTFVIYIYGFRLKKTNVFYFITLLGVSDITSCLLVIPLEIYRIRKFYAYPKGSLCRLQGYILFACYIYSTLLLLIISVERYIKVCQSSTKQMKLKLAKRLGLIAAILSLLLALPSAAWEPRTSYLVEEYIVCFKCTTYVEKKLWSYAISVFIFSFIVWATMLALYSFVLRTIKQQEDWNLQEGHELNVESVSVTRIQSSKRLSHTNRTVLCLSLVYVANFSFYFSFVIISKLATKIKEADNIHYFLFIMNESWVINILFNPIVYGFLNTKFRMEIYKMFELCCNRKDPNVRSPAGKRSSTSTRSS